MGASKMERIAERLQSLGRSGSLEGAEPLIEDLEREIDSAGRYFEHVLVEGEGER
jgi:HPt (histidine-containing phosphotransfer) domain-containing protein